MRSTADSQRRTLNGGIRRGASFLYCFRGRDRLLRSEQEANRSLHQAGPLEPCLWCSRLPFHEFPGTAVFCGCKDSILSGFVPERHIWPRNLWTTLKELSLNPARRNSEVVEVTMRSVIAFGVGAFIGAGVAMLVAPKSIEKGREA